MRLSEPYLVLSSYSWRLTSTIRILNVSKHWSSDLSKTVEQVWLANATISNQDAGAFEHAETVEAGQTKTELFLSVLLVYIPCTTHLCHSYMFRQDAHVTPCTDMWEPIKTAEQRPAKSSLNSFTPSPSKALTKSTCKGSQVDKCSKPSKLFHLWDLYLVYLDFLSLKAPERWAWPCSQFARKSTSAFRPWKCTSFFQVYIPSSNDMLLESIYNYILLYITKVKYIYIYVYIYIYKHSLHTFSSPFAGPVLFKRNNK